MEPIESAHAERQTLNIEVVAKRLGINRSTAYELARRGELPGVIRLGRRLLVSRPALEEALRLDSTQPEPDPNRVA